MRHGGEGGKDGVDEDYGPKGFAGRHRERIVLKTLPDIFWPALRNVVEANRTLVLPADAGAVLLNTIRRVLRPSAQGASSSAPIVVAECRFAILGLAHVVVLVEGGP